MSNGKKVSVLKVTVEFASRGEKFTVDFDPGVVGSIIFNRSDLERALSAQHQAQGKQPKETDVAIRKPLPADSGASIEATGSGASDDFEDDEFWWHNKNTCNWFHPDPD